MPIIPGNYHHAGGVTSAKGNPGVPIANGGGWIIPCTPANSLCWKITDEGIVVGGLVASPDASNEFGTWELLAD